MEYLQKGTLNKQSSGGEGKGKAAFLMQLEGGRGPGSGFLGTGNTPWDQGPVKWFRWHAAVSTYVMGNGKEYIFRPSPHRRLRL